MLLACTFSISWKWSPVQGCPRVFPGIGCSSRFVIHRSKHFSVVSRAEASSSPSENMELTAAAQGCCGTLAGGIVALGKFDALHIGHRALAEQASNMGAPVLLSFSGMAQVLGWEKRLPIVAPSDRARVMSLWSIHCGGVTPSEYSLEFGSVRHLSPSEFVKKLAKELQVKGVVAGENYRFGYKAAGDAAELRKLCSEWGLEVFIVESVMDKFEQASSEVITMNSDSRDRGQVSSTRVRKALAGGNMKRVSQLLGRSHRVLIPLVNAASDPAKQLLKFSLSDSCNQHPGKGSYECKVAFQHHLQQQQQPSNGAPLPALCPCVVEITDEELVLRGVDYPVREFQPEGFVVIEF